jgi:hypothetical protein
MPAPVIVLHIQESYWCSKHRGIGLNLASVAVNGQSCPWLGWPTRTGGVSAGRRVMICPDLPVP